MRRGTTLAEVLLSMFIILIVVGVAGSLVKSYASVIRHSRAQDRTLAAAQLAIDAVKSELESARAVTVGTTDVQLDRVDPRVRALPGFADGQLPPLAPSPFPAPTASWQSFPASALEHIRYYLDAGNQLLMRTSSVAGTQLVTDAVAGFACADAGLGTYSIEVAVTEDKRVIRLSTVAVVQVGR